MSRFFYPVVFMIMALSHAGGVLGVFRYGGGVRPQASRSAKKKGGQYDGHLSKFILCVTY